MFDEKKNIFLIFLFLRIFQCPPYGCVDEGGIESGVERKMQVALSSGPGQEQGDIHVLLLNVSVLDDLLVLQLSFRSFNFENRIP